MITVVTGAGISAPSGIPVYRNGGAGWDNARLEKISHYTRYGNHLDELWEFWGPLYKEMIDAVPNDAHRALAKLNCNILTQNIDSLHDRGGRAAIELHGSIYECICIRCKKKSYTYQVLWGGGRNCVYCGTDRVRPAVTLFGEPLNRGPREALTTAKRSDTVVFIGTSGNVWPVAGLADKVKKEGGRTILINKEPWGDFDEIILGDVEDTVPKFVERTNNEENASKY